jgi:hypothetical protein
MRVVALLGVGWVQFILAGPGVHDPDCVHHRPGATGVAHATHSAAGPESEAPAEGHGAHQAPLAGDHGGAPPEGGSETGECTCSGLCVPGAPAGLTLPQATTPFAPAPAISVSTHSSGVASEPLPPVASLQPPATGPPHTA